MSRALAGIGFMLAAVACFAVLDTTTKAISLMVPALMALWFRNLVQASITTALALRLRGPGVLRTRHPRLQVLRGALLLGTSLFAFLSLRHMPVGEFTSILMTTPLVVTALAALVLGERVSLLRWLLVLGGFGGVLLILRPGAQALGWALAFPLALVACNAGFQLLTSRLAKSEDPITTHVWTGGSGLLLTTLALPFVITPLPQAWLWLALGLIGLAGTVGHFLLILAYQRAPASTLTPFNYAQIGFATLGGWLVFGHMPDALSFAGIALVAACGAGGAWLTAREGRPAPPVED